MKEVNNGETIEIIVGKNGYPDKVKVADIKVYNEIKKVHALQTLINKAEELEQKLVIKSDFICARDAVECNVCHKRVDIKSALNPNGQCKKCEREIIREIAQKAAVLEEAKNWKQLEADLKKENPDYFLNEKNTKIIRKFYEGENNASVMFSIYREGVYSRSINYRQTGYSLKIGCSLYSYSADRLKKDFGAKNLAQSLHKRIEKIILEITKAAEKMAIKREKKSTFIEKLIEAFGITKEEILNRYSHSYGRNQRTVVFNDSKEVHYKKLKVIATTETDNKLSYSIKGIDKELNIKQVKDIAKLIDSF